MTELNEALVDLILKEAEAQGVSRLRLSKEAGITRTRLSDVLNAEKPGTVGEFEKLCTVLHLRLSETVAEAERRLKLQTTHTEPALEIDPVQYAAETESKLATLDSDHYTPAAYGERKED